MELVNDIYWAYSIDDLDLSEGRQQDRFTAFMSHRHCPPLSDGSIGYYKTDVNEFYKTYGYSYWDRINE
jgi:hypothetical protein